jgi:hypothetical protein
MKQIIQGVIATLVSVCGCELTTELGSYPTAEGDITGTHADVSESGTDLDGESGESGSRESDPTETSSGDGDGDGDLDEGVCAIDGSEDPCRICLEHLCCDQLESCDAELGCFCMLDCLAQFDPVTCAMTCTPALAYFQLLQCQAMGCAAVCQ